MARFTIQLPDHSEWYVRSGRVSKKTLVFTKKNAADVRTGYIIINKSNLKQYRFLKTSEGNWINKSEAGFEANDDEISILIKKQIDKFEKMSPII